MKYLNILIIMATVLFAACGGGSEQAPKEEVKEGMLLAPEEVEEENPLDIPEFVELTIEGTDQMKYNITRLEAYEGQTVKLTLKHVGEMPIEAMGHNWVLLQAGVDMEAFAMAAITAKDKDYIPADKVNEVIANTKTLGGGEEVTIEFTAPAKGSYKFLCTFPGHYGMMNGEFVVM